MKAFQLSQLFEKHFVQEDAFRADIELVSAATLQLQVLLWTSVNVIRM